MNITTNIKRYWKKSWGERDAEFPVSEKICLVISATLWRRKFKDIAEEICTNCGNFFYGG